MKLKKKYWVIIAIVIIAAAGITYGAMNKKPTVEYTTADVSRGTLIQSVSETGTITPAKEIDLNFSASGQLTKMNVKVGDQVVPEQIVGEIDSSNLNIRRQEASASLAVSQANVRQAQSGFDSARREYDKLSGSLNEVIKQAEKTTRDLEDTGPATLTTYEQAISTAQSALASTKSTYQQGIDNKNSSLNLTISNKLGGSAASLEASNRLFLDDDLRPTFSVKNSSALSSAKTSYNAALSLVAAANSAPTFEKTQTALNKVLEALNFTFAALEASIPNTNYSQAELDAAKNGIDGQITVTTGAMTSLQNAKQALDDAKLSYDTNVLAADQNVNQAKANYNNALLAARNSLSSARFNRDQQLASAQTRIDNAAASLSVAQAQVSQANASVQLIQNQIADNMLKSPIKGIITKINYEIGEQVSAQKALLSVLTENSYQIEVDISETDITKLKTGDTADITLDALGPEVVFAGKVYFIEPAATVIQGVTYYKVKISFEPGEQSAVKPGMTASAVILTAKRENVLIMPARAVVEKNGNGTIVRILQSDNTVREEPVVVGLTGDNGMVEVISGVTENDKVVTFVKDSSKK